MPAGLCATISEARKIFQKLTSNAWEFARWQNLHWPIIRQALLYPLLNCLAGEMPNWKIIKQFVDWHFVR